MLIALFIIILSGGSYEFWPLPEDFSDRVELAITDENRRENVVGLYLTMYEDAAEYNDKIKEAAEKIILLSRDHNETAEDLKIIVGLLVHERKAVQEKILDNRLNIAWQMEPEEWTKLFNSEIE